MTPFNEKKQTELIRSASSNVPEKAADRTYQDLTQGKMISADALSISMLGSAVLMFSLCSVVIGGTLGWTLGILAFLALAGLGVKRLADLPLHAFDKGVREWAVGHSIELGQNPDYTPAVNSGTIHTKAMANLSGKDKFRLITRRPVAVEIYSHSAGNDQWEDTSTYKMYERDGRLRGLTVEERTEWIQYKQDAKVRWESKTVTNSSTKKVVLIAHGPNVGVVSWSEDSPTKRWMNSVDNALSLVD